MRIRLEVQMKKAIKRKIGIEMCEEGVIVRSQSHWSLVHGSQATMEL